MLVSLLFLFTYFSPRQKRCPRAKTKVFNILFLFSNTKVQVAIENNPINPVFGFICEGDSDKSHQLLLRDGRVNKPLAEVCSSRPIRIGFNNFQDVFYVYENDTVHEYPYTWTLGKGPSDYEILKPFFHSQRLIPTWLYCDQDWGFINKSTGLPSGGTLALVSTHLLCLSYAINNNVGCKQRSRSWNSILWLLLWSISGGRLFPCILLW